MGRPAPKRILVVDEREKVRKATCGILRDAGYDCSPATNANAALDLLARDHVDLVVAEVMLGGDEGLDLISRVRTADGVPAPRVLATSGFVDFRAEALSRGASAYLLEPIDREDLLVAVETLLDVGEHPPLAAEQAELHTRDTRERTVRAGAGAVSWLRQRVPDIDQRARRATEWLRCYLSLADVIVVLNDEDGPRVIGSSGGSSSALRAESAWRRLARDVMETESGIALPDLGRWIPQHDGAPEDRIGFFAGVPIFGPLRVPVGALCAFDVLPRAVDSDDTALLEEVGRRGSELLGGLPGQTAVRWLGGPGLLVRVAFEAVLRGEIRRLERMPHALELAVLSVRSTDRFRAVSETIQHSTSPVRRALADLGDRQLALFVVRDAEGAAAAEVGAALEAVRPFLDGVGIVSIDSGGFPLPDAVQLLRMAERLAARHALRLTGRMERLLVRPEDLAPPPPPERP